MESLRLRRLPRIVCYIQTETLPNVQFGIVKLSRRARLAGSVSPASAMDLS
jgi:hypothetical protein